MNIKWKGNSKMKTALVLPVIGVVASVFLFFGELCFACASGIVKLCRLEKAGVADEQFDEPRPSESREHAGAGSRGRQ